MVFQDFLIGALVMLVGAAFCFVGYRFFRILIAIWGFFAGFNLGAAAMTALFSNSPFLQTTTGIVLGLVIGVVFAALAYFFYYFAVVLLGASAGYALGSGLMEAIGLNNPGFIAVIVGVVLAVVFAFLTVVFTLLLILIFGIVFTVVFCGDQISPGLFVVAGGRPPGGFKEAAQDIRRNRLVSEGARTPAVADQVMNGRFCGCRLLHIFP